MAGLAGRLNDALVKMRLGKGRHEVQLWLRDGSYLHFRHDPHTRWVQPSHETDRGIAEALSSEIERFELRGRRLLVWFTDESQLELRLGGFGRLWRKPTGTPKR